jgi:hypothetical protein
MNIFMRDLDPYCADRANSIDFLLTEISIWAQALTKFWAATEKRRLAMRPLARIASC